MSAVQTPKRRPRKAPRRLGPHPAGSPRAIELVRGFVAQQRRIARGQAEVEAELARRRRASPRHFV